MATFAFDAVLNTQLTESERLAAARTLATYRGRPGANRLISMAFSKISQELATARTSASRELAFALKTALSAKKQ